MVIAAKFGWTRRDVLKSAATRTSDDQVADISRQTLVQVDQEVLQLVLKKSFTRGLSTRRVLGGPVRNCYPFPRRNRKISVLGNITHCACLPNIRVQEMSTQYEQNFSTVLFCRTTEDGLIAPDWDESREAELKGQFEVGLTVADRYFLKERLGDGAMGRVFLAKDLRLDRPVAMKVIIAPSAQRRKS